MRNFLARHPRIRVAVAWIGLVVVAVVLLRWVEPATFESPYNNF